MPKLIINPNNLPTLLVSGASGLVGRNFIDSAKHDFYIYAIARKNQRDAGVVEHENIRWLRCDIGERQSVENLFYRISQETTIDFFFHFAGYYNFTNGENPEYQRTNVDGTHYLLENAKQLQLKRFIFSSPLAITDYTI